MSVVVQGKSAKIVAFVLLQRKDRVYLVQYRDPPNGRKGWWIPGPDLEYGEHPDDRCKAVLRSLELDGAPFRLAEIESFVGPDWHLIFHYVAQADREPKLGAEYVSGRWFDVKALPDAKEFPHGKWELGLIRRLTQ